MARLHSKAVKQLYKEWAEEYDNSASVGIHYLAEKGIFIETVDPQYNDSILDVGCGTGRNIRELLKYTSHVTGIDISSEMLQIAKLKFPKVTLYEADIEDKIPLPDMAFDKITCSLTFQFFSTIVHPLQEFKRLLKPGGRAYLTDFLKDSPINWKDVAYKVERKFKGSPASVSTFRSRQEYLSAFEKAGLTLIKTLLLPVPDEAKRYLTADSYEKIKGKWATVLFVLER